MGSGGDIVGPLSTALGVGLTAAGAPQAGVPLLASGINQTANPGGDLSKLLTNTPMMAGAGMLGGRMMQPQQPPPMPQPRQPMPARPLPGPPQASSATAPPLQTPSQMGMGGGQPQLTPQMMAMLRAQMGMG